MTAESSARLQDDNGRRRPGRPVAPELTARRRGDIITTAVRLFVERGYDATTLDDIARELGFTKGVIYHYFRNKAEIIRVASVESTGEMVARHEAITCSDLPPDEKLRRLVYDFVHAVVFDYQKYLVILADRSVLGGPSADQRRLELVRAFVRQYRSVIEEGIAAGVFRSMDAGVAALTLIQGIIGVARWYRPDGRLSRSAICDQVTAMLMASVHAS